MLRPSFTDEMRPVRMAWASKPGISVHGSPVSDGEYYFRTRQIAVHFTLPYRPTQVSRKVWLISHRSPCEA